MTGANPVRTLDSWKEIADYLKRTVRTVQRWEATEGLPVHRQQHQSLGNVFAYPDELDDWLAQRQEHPPTTAVSATAPSRWPLVLLAIGAVVAVAVLFLRTQWPSGAGPPVWVLVTALDNRTGESLFDDTIPFLLEREIANSTQVYVAPRVRVEDSLRLMRKDTKIRVDEALGREVCLRDGGIRLLVTSRMERTGAAYLLSVGLVESASGRLLGSSSGQAQTHEEIPPVVQRLAATIRRAAGDSNPAGKGEDGLVPVTTSSLRASQLYSQAFREGGRVNWPVAEKLAREALAEDPQFASAHLWLAWAVRNQKGYTPEAQSHLEKAVALSASATDRERQFILASQMSLQGKNEDAVVAYRRMLASYPDDYWARNNLIYALSSLGRSRESAIEVERMVDFRPNSAGALAQAMQLAVGSDLERARKYRDRLRRMVEENPENAFPAVAPGLAAFDLHELLLTGKLEELRAEVDRIAQSPNTPAVQWARSTVSILYEDLGRMRDAESYLVRLPASAQGIELVLLAYLRDDGSSLRRSLSQVHSVSSTHSIMFTLLSVRRDWQPERLRGLLPEVLPAVTLKSRSLMLEGRLASLQGDLPTAIKKIAEVRELLPSVATVERLFLDAALARAYELAGDDVGALRTLEIADVGPAGVFNPWSRSVAFWHRIRYERARLLRKAGRFNEAEPIETALKRDLRLADPDHPLVVRLSQAVRKPLDLY